MQISLPSEIDLWTYELIYYVYLSRMGKSIVKVSMLCPVCILLYGERLSLPFVEDITTVSKMMAALVRPGKRSACKKTLTRTKCESVIILCGHLTCVFIGSLIRQLQDKPLCPQVSSCTGWHCLKCAWECVQC